MRIKFLFIFSIMIIFISGCSLLNEPSKAHYSGYYKCNWTAEGKIIASKQEWVESLLGSDNPMEGTHYIVEINPNNPSDEKSIISKSVGNYYVSYSHRDWESIRTITALLQDGNNTVVYHSYNENSTVNSPAINFYLSQELIKTENVLKPNNYREFNSNLFFDTTKEKILFYIDKKEFSIYSKNGNLIKNKKIGGFAVWKDTDNIFFYDQNNKLALYTISSDSVQTYSVSFKPEYYNPTENILLNIKNGVLQTFSLDSNTIIATKNLSYDYQTLKNHYFAPDGTKLLLNKQGFFESFSGVDSLSIFIYDLQSDQLTKIRD